MGSSFCSQIQAQAAQVGGTAPPPDGPLIKTASQAAQCTTISALLSSESQASCKLTIKLKNHIYLHKEAEVVTLQCLNTAIHVKILH